MILEEKIRHHCNLVVEYKDVDAIFSLKNAELVLKYFFEYLSTSSTPVNFSLYFDVAQTFLELNIKLLELTKQQILLLQPPQNSHDFCNYFRKILDSLPLSEHLFNTVFYWFKSSASQYINSDCKELFSLLIEKSIQHHNKIITLETSLILLKYFELGNYEQEELHLTVIAVLVSIGANDFVRSYHQKTIHSQTAESKHLRQYNLLLSYFNDRNIEEVEKLRNEMDGEYLQAPLRNNYKRIIALHLARLQKNNEAKEILEELANEYVNEKNTKEYLKIHSDIVSIIPNDSVEKFANYLNTIEHVFEQSQSKDYLLIVYAKKHEYAKLQNKYEAISLAKSFLLATSIDSYEFLEEVSFQLSELAKKRKKVDQAIEFLTISTNAKTAVFESRLVAEKQKNIAERLVIEYFGAI